MSANDMLLFVGYEDSTGAVLSVAGVTVLGIRAPIRIMPGAKKKFSGGADYDRDFAKGYAECKRCFAASSFCLEIASGSPAYLAGWEKCKREQPTRDKIYEGGTMPVESLHPRRPAEEPMPSASQSMSQDHQAHLPMSSFNLAVRGW